MNLQIYEFSFFSLLQGSVLSREERPPARLSEVYVELHKLLDQKEAKVGVCRSGQLCVGAFVCMCVGVCVYVCGCVGMGGGGWLCGEWFGCVCLHVYACPLWLHAN